MTDFQAGHAGKTLVTQGEVRVASSTHDCFSAILGSCIATVIWDPELQVGGINHLLTPKSRAPDPTRVGHDINLMELLINGVLAAGGRRDRLEAKMFGGAQMINGLGSTGAANATFVEKFLRDEGIPCTARSTGGTNARRIRAWPALGRVQQIKVRPDDPVTGGEREAALRAQALRLSGVELL